MGRALKSLFVLGLAGLGAGWWLTAAPAPDPELETSMAATGADDAQAGALVFAAAGCGSCHTSPDAPASSSPVLGGGKGFASPFGTFYAPNISSHPEQGIGAWDGADFAWAVMQGVSPEGQHYYPAFPYTAYQHMSRADLRNLFAYMRTLPASDTPSRAHDVGFPFNIRRGVGAWKIRYGGARDVPVSSDPQLARGIYLVEALSHCTECHTPRDSFGGLDQARWLQGADHPSGKGKIPGITPDQLDWSAEEITEYLTSGFTPDYDSAGGEMAEVIENLAQLSVTDRQAIAAYLKAMP